MIYLKAKRNFSIKESDLKNFLRTFYGLFAYITLSSFPSLFSRDLFHEDAHWQWPVIWLGWNTAPLSLTLKSLFLLTFSAQVFATIYVYNRASKFTAMIGFTMLAAAEASFGNFSFKFIAFALSSLCLAFIAKPESKFNELNANEHSRFYFWSAQFAFLLTYTLSGLWKIRGFIASMRNDAWYTVDPIAYQISNYRLQYFDFRPPTSLLPVPLGFVLWIGVIALETLSCALAFYPGLQRVWGILVILMHVSTGLIMNIYYEPHVLLAIIFLLCHPYSLTETRRS